MGLLNKYTVGTGLFAGSYGSGLLSMFNQDQGSNPMASVENKRMMLGGTWESGRYFGNEGGVSVAGFAGVGLIAGAVLGGGVSLAARRFLPEAVSERNMFRSAANWFGKTGIDGSPIVSSAANGVMDIGPKNGALLLGVVSGGVVGAFAGGYAGSSFYDYGVSRLTHNYLNSAGGSDVQGSMEMKAPPTPAGALAMTGLGLGIYGAHQFGGRQLMSFMADKNKALIEAGKPPIRPMLQTAATYASSRGMATALAGTTVYSVTQKMNSINTNPNASKIEGLRY